MLLEYSLQMKTHANTNDTPSQSSQTMIIQVFQFTTLLIRIKLHTFSKCNCMQTINCDVLSGVNVFQKLQLCSFTFLMNCMRNTLHVYLRWSFIFFVLDWVLLKDAKHQKILEMWWLRVIKSIPCNQNLWFDTMKSNMTKIITCS